MDTIALKPERQAQLEAFARRRGKNPVEALDETLASFLEDEVRDFEEATAGIQSGYDDVRAGRHRNAAEFVAELRRKHELPG